MFEFYFQRGEFSADSPGLWEMLWQLVVQILATFGAAWFAVRLYRLQKQDSDISANTTLTKLDDQRLIYLTQLLSGVDKFVLLFHPEVVRIVKLIENSKADVGGLGLPSENDVLRICNNIDQQAYYLAYVTRYPNRYKDIGSIFLHVDNIAKLTEILKSTWLDHRAIRREQGSYLQGIITQIIHTLRDLQTQPQPIFGRVKLLLQILDSYLLKNHENPAEGVSFMDSLLFEPMAKCLDGKMTAEEFEVFKPFYDLLGNGSSTLTKMKIDASQLMGTMKSCAEQLEKSGNIIREAKSKLVDDFGHLVS